MNAEQFKRVREIFEAALESDPADLRAWLDARCGADAQLRQEVGALLQINSRAGSFLADDVASRLPELLSEDGALAPGTQIGSYTIERELGRGGMGHVYLARDARIGRAVAVKALPPRLGRDPAQRERLRREAQAAGALTHPGICTVYALEELNGDLFIVSEYVEGRTLREEIGSRRKPSAADVVQTARELAAAMASAHAKGITHRDLKPENVMRTTDGRLKVLDFGLARFERTEEGAAGHVTQPGTLVGTPAYMAPEQLNGQAVDARADVFAFGVLIYEYATGTHPFEATSPLGIAARVLESAAPSIADRCPELPLPMVDVIERCLRKLPDERFASASELVTALARLHDVPAVRRGAVTVWWRRHQLVVIALYVLASVLAWFIKEWLHGISDPIFLLIGVSATVGSLFRGHLVFTERMNPRAFPAERVRSRRATVSADMAIAVLLVVDGGLTAVVRPLVAVVTFALAVGLALTSLVVEPATVKAAFSDR